MPAVSLAEFAAKYGVFFSKGKGVRKSTLREKPDAHRAWEPLRAGLVETLQLASAGRWDDLGPIRVARFIPARDAKLGHANPKFLLETDFQGKPRTQPVRGAIAR